MREAEVALRCVKYTAPCIAVNRCRAENHGQREACEESRACRVVA